jgi:beta-glucuronidase
MSCKFKIQNSKCKIEIQNLKFWILICNFAFCILLFTLTGFADDKIPSGELITKAWDAHGRKDTEATSKYTQQCIDLYGAEADKEQALLKELPKGKEEIEKVVSLNDVATAYFIRAESCMRQDKLEEAKKLFQFIIARYPYAQAWDMRGWYWSLKTASEQSIKKLETGSIEIEQEKKVSQLPTKIVLYDAGKEDIVDYKKYGEFKNIGTKDYKYIVRDQEGLSAAVGEGIYPNTTSVKWDPAFKKAREEGRLQGSHWDFLQSPDLQAAFFKWAIAPESAGTRLFYTALILEKAGLIKHALKCYYAIVVHYPSSYGWTYWHTPWYIGQAAIAKINFLLQRNPQLGHKLSGADIRVINGYDNDVSNDIFIVSPGKFAKAGPLDKFRPKPKIDLLSIKRRLGKGKVHLLQYETGDWQLMADGRPYIIRGVTYAPTKVGQSPDDGTLGNWMEEDFNANGKIDGPYDAFVDKNRNNLQDKDEPAVGDFRLMKEMGVNAIRLYHHPLKVNKELLRDLYETYGIRVIMGDYLGKYAIGSGAPWNPGTDYSNEEQKKKMLESVTAMVNEHKDEPYLLFWILGNENVYGYGCNADKQPDAFFKFVNEAALRIKELDPEHPVALCNGDTLYLDKFGRHCPDVDIFSANAYRGNYGFGRLWRSVKEEADKPAFITEYGCPAYAAGRPVEEQEELQADYLVGSWQDMQNNTAFSGGAGNCIGGVAFEWLDEWWKAYEPKLHDTKGLWTGPFPDGHMHEEWLGFCGQGDGRLSPFLRQLRKAYYSYKKLWR